MQRNQMQSMNQMMGGGMFGMPSMMPSIMAGPQHGGQSQSLVAHQDPFAGMMSNMQQAMGNMQAQMMSGGPSGQGGQFYSSSSVMSYSSSGNGAPKVYQATSSTTQGPGGVRETKKSVRDSESGLEKIEIGHHIKERGHVIERSRNRHTGDREESQNYINIDESEGDQFNREWQQQTQSYNNSRYGRLQHPGIAAGPSNTRRHTPAITDGSHHNVPTSRYPSSNGRQQNVGGRHHQGAEQSRHRSQRNAPYDSSHHGKDRH